MYTSFTEEEDSIISTTKVSILTALTSEGIMTATEAEEWCKTHAIIKSSKSIFRTISKLWKNEQAIDGTYYLVVKLVRPKSNKKEKESNE